ncbi:putative glycoside hydrolase [Rhodococcus sp. NPDC058639]|uniref:putative glycoside hydrolase n=1 Tax=Rhodococcus sp. NPDC058639 TaxID=3346570 RepID=UPI00365D279B
MKAASGGRRARRRRWLAVLVAAVSTLSCSTVMPGDSPPSSTPMQIGSTARVGAHAAADPDAAPDVGWPPTFPRTATYYLSQDRLPPVGDLARYDLVVIDHEWAHRVPRTYFDELEAVNPRMRLLAYVNVVDHPGGLGSPQYWAGRYDLWQFSDSETSSFPQEWLATTASGTTVSEWPGTTMVNLTDEGPRVGGASYAEYAAEWVVDRVWSAGIWDGILLDVWGDRIYSADSDRWDIDRDGVDETDSQIYGPGSPWARGVAHAEALIRAQLPRDAILVANGDRTLEGDALDGRAWESFADPYAERDPRVDLGRYLAATSGPGHRDPGVWLTINRKRLGPSTEEHRRRARFFATATLLGDGFWAPMGLDYGTTGYYDELGGDSGRGYLGRPLPEAAPSGNPTPGAGGRPTEPGVYRRDFDHGIVLVNAGETTERIALERPYRKLQGVQDPITNNGEVVEEVELAPFDGIVLVHPGS